MNTTPIAAARGCSESFPPSAATELELSRIEDALNMLKGTPFFNTLWDALPQDVKADYNYSRWTYCQPCKDAY